VASESVQNVAKWALEEFANGFAAAVEGMAGARPEVSWELLSAGHPESSVPTFQWKQPLSGLPETAFATASEPDTLATGQHVMAAAGIEDASPEELKSTFRESLGQAFSMLARAMTTRLQREVTPSGGEEATETPSDAIWGSATLGLGEQKVRVFLALPAKMLEPFTVEPRVVAQAAGAGAGSRAAVPSPTPADVPPALPASGTDSRTFDLLLDVELPVSVSFGHAYVPLKDVLKLTTGSIVELSRAIVEPVDIVVNNCVIAKGEVVVVEGNFGVRIQHVVSRSERLRSLQ
jgi:flagellar motor switch protein FliN/FliY